MGFFPFFSGFFPIFPDFLAVFLSFSFLALVSFCFEREKTGVGFFGGGFVGLYALCCTGHSRRIAPKTIGIPRLFDDGDQKP